MTGEAAKVSLMTDKKVDWPWWVRSYPRFVYCSTFTLLTLMLTISYVLFEGEQVHISLQWNIAAGTYGYVLDQCTLFYCYLTGRTPIVRPGLEITIMLLNLAFCSTLVGMLDSLFIFIVLVVVRDVFFIFSWELNRVMECIDVQENDLRIYDTVTPYLKKPHEALLVLLNIPFQDGITIWLSIYFGFVVPLPEFQLSLVLMMPFKHFMSDLVNDAFYYLLHSTLHTPAYYSHHKLHHMVKHPTSWCAGIMAWQEMLETFMLTRVFTPILFYFIFGPWSIPEFLVYNVYLGILEVGGHTGCVGGNSVLFRTGTGVFMNPLGIQLEIGHHDLHHELFNVNFGKRTSLYDQLFGTYMDYRLKVPSYEGGSKMVRKKKTT